MLRLWLCVSVLYILQVQCSGQTTIERKSYNMTVGDLLTLKSPVYPYCCADSFNYRIHCTWKRCGLKIMFIDVSLSPGSTLTIYDGITNVTLITSTFENGVWSRPSIVHNKPDAVVVMHIPDVNIKRQYKGVKFEVLAFNTARNVKADATSESDCGKIQLPAWQGGEIKIIETRNIPDNLALDCVWIITKPPGAPADANVFVRFTHTSNLHGFLSVRNGSYSEASVIFEHDTAKRGQTGLDQGKEGFTSPGSLFVRVRKAFDRGALTFTYGMFTRVATATTTDQDTCNLGTRKGFLCAPSKWCIPWLDRCDYTRQCPNKEDEDNCEGFVRESPSSSTKSSVEYTYGPTTPTPRPRCYANEKYCPPEGCIRGSLCPGECLTFQKVCKDKSCVRQYQTCPGECNSWEKMCDNGQCVSVSNRCPGDCRYGETKCDNGKCIEQNRYCPNTRCPADKHNRCGDKCFSDTERCDSVRNCSDGDDEKDCSSGFPWYIILVLIGVAALILLIVYSKKRNQALSAELNQGVTSTNTRTSARPAAIAGAPNYPVVAGARGPSTPLSNNTSNYHSTDAQDAATPLAGPQPSAPPSYLEAMDEAYAPVPVPLIEPAPPPYEAVAATNLPPKNLPPV